MSKTFTKIGKEITIAIKAGGPDPSSNSRFRILLQNAKAANMPKDTIERAIKKATNKDEGNYSEIVYEGYGPYGVAILVETATDNPVRTVANVRSYFAKYDGALGTSGCVDYLFEHKCNFKVNEKPGVNIDDLELELIDYGAQEIFKDEEGIINIYGEFESFGSIQRYIEENEYEMVSAEFERIPMETKELNEEQMQKIDKLLGRFEEDDDVTNVFHNIK